MLPGVSPSAGLHFCLHAKFWIPQHETWLHNKGPGRLQRGTLRIMTIHNPEAKGAR